MAGDANHSEVWSWFSLGRKCCLLRGKLTAPIKSMASCHPAWRVDVVDESMWLLLGEVWNLSWLQPGAPQLPGSPVHPMVAGWWELQGGAHRGLGSHQPKA